MCSWTGHTNPPDGALLLAGERALAMYATLCQYVKDAVLQYHRTDVLNREGYADISQEFWPLGKELSPYGRQEEKGLRLLDTLDLVLYHYATLLAASCEDMRLETTFCATMMNRSEYCRASRAHNASSLLREIEATFEGAKKVTDERKMYIPPAVAWITIAGEKMSQVYSAGGVVASDVDLAWLNEKFKQRFAVFKKQMKIEKQSQDLACSAAREINKLEQSLG